MIFRITVVLALGGIVVSMFFAAARSRRGPLEPLSDDPAVFAAIAAANPVRAKLFAEIQPVALRNCRLQRFGERNDGGYLMCGNLLEAVEAGYSYGIAGYDGWGCEISRALSVPVHQYDCFDRRQPACPGGRTIFHAECVAGEKKDGSRSFDTLSGHIAANGDQSKRLVVKMDVESAEWAALLATPAEVLDRFAQLAIEFHGTEEERFVAVVQKLKTTFHVAHLHFNNHSCKNAFRPFPAEAYEVLFVNKRLTDVDPDARPVRPHPLDAPNAPELRDCQR